MLNKIILIGRLTRDVELRHTQQGIAVANFTLAVNRKYNRDETDFINIVVWRAHAENCAKYIGKGSLVAVEGRLEIRKYQDKEGNNRYATEVVADDVRFLSTKSERSPQDNKSQAQDDWSDLGTEYTTDDVPF